MTGAGPVEYRPDATDSGELRAPTQRASQPIADLRALCDRHEAELMANPGVTFVGVGADGLEVGVRDAESAALIPGQLEGVTIHVIITGTVRAQPG